ncbi:MAG: O-antigen ligase family protein, partial [Acidimicrobiia bacterium]
AIVALAVLRLSRRDSAAVAAAYLAVIAVFPASLQAPTLGSVGTPQIVLGVGCFALWMVTWMMPRTELRRPFRPVPLLLAAFVAANLLSYVAACLRPTDVLERSAADRGVVLLVAAVGGALLISESVGTLERFDVVLRAIVLGAAFVGLVGILQFTVGIDVASAIRLPGLRTAAEGSAFIGERSMFRRVSGTTAHAIEFSVVLCMALPVAVHLLLHRSRAWMVPTAVVAVALPMSVSRTAVLGLLGLAVVLVPGWERPVRRKVYVGAALYLLVMRLAIPGLLGTIRSLFVDAGVDPSITSRQTDYDYVTRFIAERPAFGRGFATFVPTRYDFLDNQYLLSVVETGYVGAGTFVLMLLGGMLVAQSVRRHAALEMHRDLAQALTASLAVALFTSIAFDFLSFATVRALLFVLLGCVGALWRLAPRRVRQALPPDDDVLTSAALAAARRRAAARLAAVSWGPAGAPSARSVQVRSHPRRGTP